MEFNFCYFHIYFNLFIKLSFFLNIVFLRSIDHVTYINKFTISFIWYFLIFGFNILLLLLLLLLLKVIVFFLRLLGKIIILRLQCLRLSNLFWWASCEKCLQWSNIVDIDMLKKNFKIVLEASFALSNELCFRIAHKLFRRERRNNLS